MAEDVLVKEQLTDKMIKLGKQLIDRLASTDLKVVAAFWLYRPDSNDWRLTLASPQVDEYGLRKYLTIIWEVLHKGRDKISGLDLENVNLISSDERLVRALASTNQLTGQPTGLAGKRLSRSTFNGEYLEDVYVYFVEDSVKSLPSPAWYVGDKPL